MSDYIVIGAGILGASTAYHLAASGANVTVIDRAHPGQATDAGAGIVCPWLSQRRNKPWYFLARNGAAYYPDLIKQLEALGQHDTGYKSTGALSLHRDGNRKAKTAERAIKRREQAPEIGHVFSLNEKQTKQAFPLLADHYQSVYVSGGARVNGRALRLALLEAARQLGASWIQGEEASLIHDNRKIQGVTVNNENYYAGRVILTGGAWADQCLEPLGLSFAVESQKAQILHMQIENTDTDSWPVVIPSGPHYMVPFSNGHIVVGATHEDYAVTAQPTAAGYLELLESALHMAPGLRKSMIKEMRVGFRPSTPGFLPVIGFVPETKGLLAANGLGASGLTTGPFLGAELARLAMDKEMSLSLEDYSIEGAIQPAARL